VVAPPLPVAVGENDPQGWMEQEADHVTCELLEVVALNGRLCPAPAVADVGEMVTVTGEDLPHPNSMNSEKGRATLPQVIRAHFINHPFPEKR